MLIQPQNKIAIKGGHVFDPQLNLNKVMDVFIENDTLVALGEAPVGFNAAETIDASGKMIFPGFIDLNAFLAEPGFSQKGSINSETRAASRSGITTLCSTPNCNPVVDSATLASLIQDKAQQAGYCNVLPIGALTAGLKGEQLSNMFALKEAGCVALSNLDSAFKDMRVAQQCYHYAAGFDIKVFVTPLDQALAHGGCMHEGPTSTKLGLAGISLSAETASLAQHLILCEESGVSLHFSRITSARALEMITEAQSKGLAVTADVAIGNLIFTDEDCLAYDSLQHVTPVYRSETDRQALLKAVNLGQIGICSNHRPHELAAKMAPFAAAEAGISVLDSFAGALISLVKSEQLTLEAAIKAVTATQAKVINQPVGQLAIGSRADLCILDMNAHNQMNAENMESLGQNNPWLGETLPGKVMTTINGGHIVYQA
ncbi:MAG: dihydroorotase [Bermanella sp.]